MSEAIGPSDPSSGSGCGCVLFDIQGRESPPPHHRIPALLFGQEQGADSDDEGIQRPPEEDFGGVEGRAGQGDLEGEGSGSGEIEVNQGEEAVWVSALYEGAEQTAEGECERCEGEDEGDWADVDRSFG